MAEQILQTPVSYRVDPSTLRFGCLILTIILYGLYSHPTPEDVGIVEIMIGLLLVLTVGIRHGLHAVSFFNHGEAWKTSAQILFLYAVTVPFLTAFINGNALMNMVRDFIPFMFFTLPLWICPLLKHRNEYKTLFTGAVIIAGIAFAARVLSPLLSLSGTVKFNFIMPADPFLLVNSPMVLFAGLFLLGLAGKTIFTSIRARSLYQSLGLGLLSLIPLVAMALIVQRASISYVAFMMGSLFAIGMIKSPTRMALPIILALCTLAIAWPIVTDIVAGLLRKNALVGFNMRWQEMMTVFQSLQSSSLSVIFGKGWGTTIASPAVGGATVNFTHSLLTTYWLKTGLLGLSLAILYLYNLARITLRLTFSDPVLGLAIAGVLMINTFLYASFKSLDFGLILTLIPLYGLHLKSLQNAQDCSMHKQVSKIKNVSGAP